MDDDSSLCQGCGAMLPLPDLSGLVTCPSCGRQRRVKAPTLGASAPDDPQDPGALPEPPPLGDGGWPTPPTVGGGGWPAPPVLAPTPGGGTDWTIPPGGGGQYAGGVTVGGSGNGRTVKASGMKAIGCGCLPGLVILIVMGAIGFVVFSATGGVRDAVDDAFSTDDNLSTVSGTMTVLGSGDGGTVDLVGMVQTSESGTTTRRVSRFSMSAAGPKVRWRGPTTPTDVYDVEIAQVGSTIFAGLGDELWALDATNGARRWSATLSDKVTTSCADCFAAVDGTLVVRTQDAEVAGYREASAEPLWSKRLESPSGTIAIAGDTLIVSDDPVGDDDGGISTVDPADGTVVRTFKPTCAAVEEFGYDLVLGAGSSIRPIPGSTDVVGWASSGYGCVVRWDPETGTTRFATRVEEAGLIDDETVLVSSNDLVFSSYADDVVQVSLDTGEAQRLTPPPDTSVTPARVVGRTLIATTTTTRGTTKGGLAAWNLDSGEARWTQRLPGGSQPVSSGIFGGSDALFDGSPRTVLVPAGEGIRVFTFDGTDREVTVDALDLDSGELTEVSRTDLESRYSTSSGTISLTIEAITPTRLVFSADNLLQSMSSSGEGGITTFPVVD